jgi:hypothetical protein
MSFVAIADAAAGLVAAGVLTAALVAAGVELLLLSSSPQATATRPIANARAKSLIFLFDT